MRALAWIRTGLAAGGFVWLMLTWRETTAPQRRLADTIRVWCNRGDWEFGQKMQCEIQLRGQLAGGAP